MLHRARLTLIVLSAGLCSTAASASETVTYTYDARGRLVKVVSDKPGTANDAQACYKLDKSENRTRVKVDVDINVASPPTCP